jgi:hypothetical protein
MCEVVWRVRRATTDDCVAVRVRVMRMCMCEVVWRVRRSSTDDYEGVCVHTSPCMCEVVWRVRRETTLTLSVVLLGIWCGFVLLGSGTRSARTYMSLSKS